MDKLLGDTRLKENNNMSSVLSELNVLNRRLGNNDCSLHRSLSQIATSPPPFRKPYELCTVTKPSNIVRSIIQHTLLPSVNHQSSDFSIEKERSTILTSGSNYSQYDETCSLS